MIPLSLLFTSSKNDCGSVAHGPMVLHVPSTMTHMTTVAHGREPHEYSEPLEGLVFAQFRTTPCSSLLSRKEALCVSEFIGIVCELVLLKLSLFIIVFPNAFSKLAKNWQNSLQ